MSKPQIVPGHVGYAPDYKSDSKEAVPFKVELLETLRRKGDPLGVADDPELQQVALETLLQRVADLARPILEWDRDKAEKWLPGLYDALKELEELRRTLKELEKGRT